MLLLAGSFGSRRVVPASSQLLIYSRAAATGGACAEVADAMDELIVDQPEEAFVG